MEVNDIHCIRDKWTYTCTSAQELTRHVLTDGEFRLRHYCQKVVLGKVWTRLKTRHVKCVSEFASAARFCRPGTQDVRL